MISEKISYYRLNNKPQYFTKVNKSKEWTIVSLIYSNNNCVDISVNNLLVCNHKIKV